MDIIYYMLLFLFWTMFWSFASVVITRLFSWEKWIVNGRSHCPTCNQILKVIDLVPVFSFLSTLWKCRYCKSKLSLLYPLLEISTWLLFSLIWYFLIDFNTLILWNNITEIIKLMFWLSIWFITIIYIFYDILFLEIHEWVMLTGVSMAFIWLIINSFFFPILSTFPVIETQNIISFYSLIVWIAVLSWLYTIVLKELEVKYDILILLWSILLIILFKYFLNITDLSVFPIISWVIWALWIFIFFYLQILFSQWKALGWWDLRIWIMVWLMLWIWYSIPWMMIIYFIWSIISILILIIKKIKYKKEKLNTVIPFWPFIWIGFFVTIFFQNEIQKIIEIYFKVM